MAEYILKYHYSIKKRCMLNATVHCFPALLNNCPLYSLILPVTFSVLLMLLPLITPSCSQSEIYSIEPLTLAEGSI